MERVNLRKLNRSDLFAIRTHVIQLKNLGKSRMEIEELTGVNQSAVSRIWQSYLKGGMFALEPKKPGRKKGGNTLLTPVESRMIRRTIIENAPNQVDLQGHLWTHKIISDYIERDYGKTLSLRSITNYLMTWGLTQPHPPKFICWHSDEEIKKFYEHSFPYISSMAKEANTEMYWVRLFTFPRDPSKDIGVRDLVNHKRLFTDKGKSSGLEENPEKEHYSVMAVFSNKGSVRFVVYNKNMTQRKFINFLQRLVSDIPRKIILIFDNLRLCYDKNTIQWLKENEDKIQVHSVAGYTRYNKDKYIDFGD